MKRGLSGINALIAIDKPLGISSHGAISSVRHSLGEKRVGHAGTLDPEASGVLVVGVGQATRLMGMLTAKTKGYKAQIQFGTQTTTDDKEGEVIAEAPVDSRLANREVAQIVLSSLIGPQMQTPPSFSAISINGERAYKKARAGEKVEIPAREIEILSADLAGIVSEDPLIWEADFCVSKGCYIRSIARDLGLQVGSYAHLAGLRRISSGPIDISQCKTLEEIESLGADNIDQVALDPVAALGTCGIKILSEEELVYLKQGRRIRCGGFKQPYGEDGRVCMVRDGKLYGVWRVEGPFLRAEVNFIDGISGVRL